MMKTRDGHTGGLAWLAAGASVGGLVRRVVDRTESDMVVALLLPLVLMATAAALVGLASVRSLRQPLWAFLVGAGGTAGSIGAAATRAVSATPVEAAVGLAGYL